MVEEISGAGLLTLGSSLRAGLPGKHLQWQGWRRTRRLQLRGQFRDSGCNARHRIPFSCPPQNGGQPQRCPDDTADEPARQTRKLPCCYTRPRFRCRGWRSSVMDKRESGAFLLARERHNPAAAPATVSECGRATLPLGSNLGRRRVKTCESGDRPATKNGSATGM